MNAFQTCKDTTDIIPLYIPQQLFLKPIAKINISLQLPNVVKNGKSISHLEIMEKLRELVKPQEFTMLKVSKSTLEFVRFEAEVDSKKKLEPAVLKVNNKTIKLKNFSELMRVKAAIAKGDFPTRHVWDGFFNEAKDMNESKPGERPDTLHIYNLPTKWFVPYHLLDDEDLLPSEKLFFKIFEKFGPIRHVDIPICDPYRNKMKDHISGIKNCTWEDKTIFEGYVQFRDYLGFSKCMDYLRDMKLLHKEEDETFAADMKVDFDRSKHLSDASLRRREIVRDRLVKKQREKEEKEKDKVEERKKKEEEDRRKEISVKQQKEQRRRLREEKRKAAILEKLKIRSADEINAKIAKEEKKLLKAQRKLESIRLIEELFKRIKDKKSYEEINSYNIERSKTADSELKKYKYTSEKELLDQKQKLHSVLQGRVMLKSVLKDGKQNFSSSSSDEELLPSQPVNIEVPLPMKRLPPEDMYQDQLLYGYQETYPYHLPPLYPQSIRGHPAMHLMPTRGRGGYFRGHQYPSASRGGFFNRRGRGYKPNYRGGYQGGRNNQYPPELEEEYVKYFSKFLQNDHSQHRNRERSRSSSRRRSNSRRRSYSRSRSRSNPRHRRDRSRSRRRSRSRSYSRHRSQSDSRRSRRSSSRERSRSRNKSSPRRSKRSPSRESSRSRNKSSPKRSRGSPIEERSRSRNKSNSRRSRERSRSRNKSSPKRLRRSPSKDRSRSRNRSASKERSERGNKSTSRPSTSRRTPEQGSKKGESEKKSRSPSGDSVDSSKFISPKTMRKDRSKSWSLPREEDKTRERDSWSRSPEKRD